MQQKCRASRITAEGETTCDHTCSDGSLSLLINLSSLYKPLDGPLHITAATATATRKEQERITKVFNLKLGTHSLQTLLLLEQGCSKPTLHHQGSFKDI